MGEYEPKDSRKVHAGQESGDVGNDHKTWREIDQVQNEGGKLSEDEAGKAQGGYGNAQNEQGTSEQDVAKKDRASKDRAEQARPAETSDRPDERAMGDANRPLGKD